MLLRFQRLSRFSFRPKVPRSTISYGTPKFMKRHFSESPVKIPTSDYYEPRDFTLKNLTDYYDRHRTLLPLRYGMDAPFISDNVFLAPSATVIGNVEVYPHASIWYNCIIRGDVNLIRIGYGTNIQDNTFIGENFEPIDENHDGSTIIGHYVTIGHNCILKACTIEDQCYVGMNSILEPNSYMEKESMLGANSVLTDGSRVHSGELWLGNPAKFYRKLTQDEIEGIKASSEFYQTLGKLHENEFSIQDLAPVRQALKEGLLKD